MQPRVEIDTLIAIRAEIRAGIDLQKIAVRHAVNLDLVEKVRDGHPEFDRYSRCEQCGHQVTTPCRICAARGEIA